MRFFDRFRRHVHHASIRNPKPVEKTGPDRLRLALEPRFLFDASGLMAGLDIAGAVDPDSHSGPDGHPDGLPTDSIMAPSMTPPVFAVGPREIVFIDSRVADAESLVRNLPDGVAAVTIAADQDGVALIGQYLAENQGVATVHILSHGEPGSVTLGNMRLDAGTIEQSAGLLTTWQQGLSENADILIYGCHVAGSVQGEALLVQLSDLTGADVAASVDATGSSGLGGDWDLEVQIGEIEAESLASDAWDGLLALPAAGGDKTVTDTSDNPVSIAEDSPAPGAANIRLTPAISDADPAQPTTARILSVDGGVVTDAAGGAVVLGEAGTELSLTGGNLDLRFTPDADRAVDAAFTYVLVDADGEGNSAASTATISITAVNDAPAGANHTVTTLEDTDYTFTTADFGFSDVHDQPADTLLAVKVATLPGAGVLTDDGVAVTAGDLVAVADINAGKLRFAPAADANGAGYASFTFQVQDDGGTNNGGVDLDPTPNTMSIDVTSVNDAPSGADHTVTTLEDTTYTFSAADFGFSDVNDLPVNVMLAVKEVTLPGAGALTNNGVALMAGATVAVADINAGKLQFTPAPNANGAGYASFTFQIQDDGGTDDGGVDLDPTPNTMTIDVTSVNDDPAWTVPGAQTVAEDVDLVFSSGNGNAITVADLDVGEAPGELEVTLAVSKGGLSLSQTTGLTFSTGDGTADKTMTFTGTAAQINLALAGLTYRGDQDYNTATDGAETLVLTVNDQGHTGSGGGSDIVRSVAITVTQVNDDPASTAPGDQTVPEDTELVFSAANGNAITVADLDHDEPGGGELQVTLSVDHGVLTLSQTAGLTFSDGDGTADPAMTFTGTAANINAALDGLIYLGDANYNTAAGGVEILVLPVNDQGNTGTGGGGVIDQAVGVTVTPVNDDPVWTVPGSQAVTEDGGMVFSSGRGNAITVADLDHGEPGGGELQVSLSVSYGVLTLSQTTGLTFAAGDGTADATMTFSGTAAAINAALEGLFYRGDRDANTTAVGSEVLRLTVNDQGHTGIGGGADIVAAVGIGVEQVNDDPVWMVPGAQTVAEDTNLVFSSGHGNLITVADLDHEEPGGGPLMVTLAVSHGELTLNQTTRLSFVAGDGHADSTMTFSGTAAAVNAALDGLVYRGATNYNAAAGGAETLTLTVNDQGHTGSGGGGNITQAVGITVTPVNDDPVWTVPRAQTVAEDTNLVFRAAGGNAITVADPDSGEPGGGPLKVTLAAEHGVLTLGRSTGLTFSAGDGTADAAMTFSGTPAAVNAALDGLVYRGEANYNTPADGAETLTLTVSDQGNTGSGGGRDIVQAVGIAVAPVNDDPAWSVPEAQTVAEDTDLTFSASGGNAITVADPDSGEPGGGSLQVTLAAEHGVLTLSRSAGLSFTDGDGTADAAMIFSGTEAAINAALDGLVYRGDADYNTAADGAETLTLTVNDQGNTGSGGGQDIVQAVGITVTAVNDDPTWSVPEPQTAVEDTDLVFSAAGGNAITVADPDSGEPGGGALQVTLAAAHGVLTLGRSTDLSFSQGDGTVDATMTFTGTPAAINAALDGLVYRGDPHYSSPHSGAETLTLTVNDQGNAGIGGGQNIQRTVPIQVVPVADAPELTAEPTACGNQDTAIALTIMPPRLVDTDGSEQLGDITIDGVPAGAYLSAGARNTDGSWTVTAAQLPGLTITPPALDHSDFTLTVRLTSTEAATGAAASTSRTIAVEVLDVFQHSSSESSPHGPSSTGRAGLSPDRTDTPFEPDPPAEPAGWLEALSGPAMPTIHTASYGLGPDQEIIRYQAVVMARELGLSSPGDPGRGDGFKADDPLVAFNIPAEWFDPVPSGTDANFAASPSEPIDARPMVQPAEGFAVQLRRAASDFERHRSAQMAALAELIRSEATAAPADGS